MGRRRVFRRAGDWSASDGGIVCVLTLTSLTALAIGIARAADQSRARSPTSASASEPVTRQAPELYTCLAVAADLSPVFPTDLFLPTKEMTVSFRLADGEAHRKMECRWVALDAGPEAANGGEFGKGSLELKGSTAGAFRLSGLSKAMPPGNYRVDVVADGAPWKSKTFRVEPSSKLEGVEKPDDLMPLGQAKTWSYDFVQEAGGDAKVILDDVAPDADGKFRAAVTMTDAGRDTGDSAEHFELRRNGKLVFQEWFAVDKHGVSSVRRKTPDGTVTVDPPQPLWPWPVTDTPRHWTYSPKDKSYKLAGTMWGPLPIATPSGARPGFIVMYQQSQGVAELTVERHFVPGVGLVSETVINAVNHKMVGRQEMTLRAMP